MHHACTIHARLSQRCPSQLPNTTDEEEDDGYDAGKASAYQYRGGSGYGEGYAEGYSGLGAEEGGEDEGDVERTVLEDEDEEGEEAESDEEALQRAREQHEQLKGSA